MVVAVTADPRGLRAGLRESAAAIAAFSNQGVAKFKRSFEGMSDANRGALALIKTETDRYAKLIGASREELFRGDITKKQFATAAQLHAETYNKNLLRGLDELRGKKGVNSKVEEFIQSRLKVSGLEGGTLAVKEMKTKLDALDRELASIGTVKSRAGAKRVLVDANTRFDAGEGARKTAMAGGAISRKQYEAMGLANAQAYNRAIIAGMATLDGKKMLRPDIQSFLATKFKEQGFAAAKNFNEAYERGIAQGKKIQSAGGKITTIGMKATIGITGPILAAAAASFQLGAEADRTGRKMDQVFGNAARSVNSQLTDMRRTIPATTSELQNMSSGFAELFMSLGAGRSKSNDMSVSLVRLAGDMAAFRGVDMKVALQALQSGIAGQPETLRRYGIAINETAIKQEGMRLGFLKQREELTPLGKAMATYSVIMRQSAILQGYASRTSETATQQYAFLKSQLKESAMVIGTALIPVILPLIRSLTEFLKIVSAMNPNVTATILRLAAMAAVFGPLTTLIGGVTGAFGFMLVAIRTLMGPTGLAGLAALVTPQGLIVAGLGAIALAAYKIYDAMHRDEEALKDFKASLADLTASELGVEINAISGSLVRLQEQLAAVKAKGVVNPLGGAKSQGAYNTQIKDLTDKILLLQRERNTALAEITSRAAKQPKLDEETKRIDELMKKMNSDLSRTKLNVDPLKDFYRELRKRTDAAIDGTLMVRRGFDEAIKSANSFADVRALVAKRDADMVAPLGDLMDRQRQVNALAEEQAKHGEVAVEIADRQKSIQQEINNILDQRRGDTELIAKKVLGSYEAVKETVGANLDNVSKSLIALDDYMQSLINDAAGPQHDISLVNVDILAAANNVRSKLNEMLASVGRPERGIPNATPLVESMGSVVVPTLQVASAMAATAIQLRIEREARKRMTDEIFRQSMDNAAAMADFKLQFSDVGLTGQAAMGMVQGAAMQVLSAFTPLSLIAYVLEGFFRGLAPLMESLRAPLEVVGMLLAASLTPALRAMFPALRMFGVIITFLGEMIARVVAAISQAVGGFVRAIGTLIGKVPGLGGLGKSIRNFGDSILNFSAGQKESAERFRDARLLLEKMQFGDTADSILGLGAAARDTAEQLQNVPSGFRIALQQFLSSLPEPQSPVVPVGPPAPIVEVPRRGGTEQPGGGPGGAVAPNYFTGDITIVTQAKNARELYDDLQAEGTRRVLSVTGAPSLVGRPV
jgi:hypothetical protein